MGGEEGLWVEARGIWAAMLIFSNSTFHLTQSSSEGPKFHDAALMNKHLFASGLLSYIKSAVCVCVCVFSHVRVCAYMS